TIDDADAVPFPRGEMRQHLLALAHQEDRARPPRGGATHVLRIFQVDLVSTRLEVLAGQAEDLRVVVFTARRMRPLAEDSPAMRAHRFLSPPGFSMSRPVRGPRRAPHLPPDRRPRPSGSPVRTSDGLDDAATSAALSAVRARPAASGAARARTRGTSPQ